MHHFSSPPRPVLLALLPPSARGDGPELARTLGLRWEEADSVGRYLAALGNAAPRFSLVSFGVEGVDEALVQRVRAATGEKGMELLLSSPKASLAHAVAALRLDAGPLLSEPLREGELGPELRRRGDPGSVVEVPPAQDTGPGPGLAGSGPAMMEVVREIARVGAGPTTVLVTGESGTGKELVARAIHWASPRASGPFVAINCSAVPEPLLESEFFGHERGAFTGAVARRVGRFERAEGGTLFLDEVGDMSLVLQAKLLRVLEEREVERIGGEGAIPVDVRIVAATNRSLEERAQEGSFREDLLFRLAVARIHLPPLRERIEDLPELVFHFAHEFGSRHGKRIRGISSGTMERMASHPWPGNVRELRNVIERAVLSCRDGYLREEDLRLDRGAPGLSARPAQGAASGYPPTWSLRSIEMDHIRRVLEYSGGRLTEAADILGIHRNTLRRKLRDDGTVPAEEGRAGNATPRKPGSR